jgi:hypothetical protein
MLILMNRGLDIINKHNFSLFNLFIMFSLEYIDMNFNVIKILLC